MFTRRSENFFLVPFSATPPSQHGFEPGSSDDARIFIAPPSQVDKAEPMGHFTPLACSNDAHNARQLGWLQRGELWPKRSEIQCVRDGLYITNYFGARKLVNLEQQGITHVVVCADELPRTYASRFRYLKLEGLTDNTHTHLRPHLARAVPFVRDALAEGGHVLFHCASGSSRSGSVLVATLMALFDMSLVDALSDARRARPIVQPNAGFVEQLSDDRLIEALRAHKSPIL